MLECVVVGKIAGLYKITNKLNGKCYIGSSVDIPARFRCHKSYLRRGIHTNIHLQRAYDKYGRENFVYSIILLCEPDDTLLYEQMLLDAGVGDYNIAEDATAPMKGRYGELNSFYGRKHSKETRELISKNHADVSGKNHPLYGKHLSKESREKISKNHADFSGKNNPNYGKRGKDSHFWGHKHSEEAKRKMSKALKKYWANNKDRSVSDEQKEKISKGLKEHYKTHESYERTDEIRQKISEGLKKYYKQKSHST